MQTKNFVVSTADFAFKHNGMLACTGTTNLNTSINVSMQEQNVQAGKGNKMIFTYKYGRELTIDLEAADWRLEYIAMNTGSEIFDGLSDVYSLNECVTLTNGVGQVQKTPIGNVGVELPTGVFVEVEPEGTQIDLSVYNLGEGTVTVKATYRYNADTRYITIDADSAPLTGELILDADKYDNKNGKAGSVQIIVPSYSLDGNFDLSFTPDGVTSTAMSGRALAIEGDTCENNSAVYAYVKEIRNSAVELPIIEIVANAPTYTLVQDETATISVIGSKGVLYKSISIDNKDCNFTADEQGHASVTTGQGTGDGVVTAVSEGKAKITVDYKGIKDKITFNVLPKSE